MRVRAIAFTTTVLLGLAALILAGADPGPRVNLQWPYPPSDASPPPATLGNPQKMLPYFDDYSWKTFLAMVWPAARGRRGVPDERQTVASQMKPKVFETFKAAWEVFHADKNGHLDGSPPADWNYYDQGKYNACSQNVQFGDLVLASFSKFTDVGQAGFGTLDPALCGGRCGPLMARNFTFLHYLTGYNEPVFLQVQAQQLYLHVQPGVGFQASQEPGKSALTVKSSWMEMRDFDAAHQARYYTRDDVWVRGTDGICRKEKVGLVGLHIVQRTLSRTQWIWTSFEQVDNVPPPDPLGSDGTFALYKAGAPDLRPYPNPYPFDPNPAVPLIFRSVRRLRPIHPSTQATNLAYREALRATGSVWQYYQLVMTQFPIRSDLYGVEGAKPENTFPGSNYDRTDFSNVTMETFNQDDINHSCLGCHIGAGEISDFIWSLADRPTGGVQGDQFRFTMLKRLLSARPR